MSDTHAGKATHTIYDFTAKTIDGKDKRLADYKGNVLLVVNVASECGYTPQYDGLEKLHEKYAAKGLRVLGFPANEFGGQEPGSDGDIQSFCTSKFGVKFDMFSKVKVNGEGMHPLFDWLQSAEANPEFGAPIKWNFYKFLVDRNGHVIGRFAHKVEPESAPVVEAIEKALAT
jgi:glutathione peroxidase